MILVLCLRANEALLATPEHCPAWLVASEHPVGYNWLSLDAALSVLSQTFAGSMEMRSSVVGFSETGVP